MKWQEKRRRGIMLGLAVVMTLILIFGKNEKEPEIVETTGVEGEAFQPYSGTGSAIIAAPAPEETPNPEDQVYSFFQGPKSWEEKREWAGKWGKEFYDGSNFGAFGCGFCCMANLYSTLTKYECSPVDIYERAKKVTFYGGGGAISWQLMRKTMADIGFNVKLGEKPSTYEAFRNLVEANPATLVLVSSYNDDSYWKNTPGHYVTLFLYEPETDTVFLTDSGDPSHNRHRVKLKTIYKALKTSSDFQYMTVVSYEEEKDNWKHKEAGGTWVKPEILNKKEEK